MDSVFIGLPSQLCPASLSFFLYLCLFYLSFLNPHASFQARMKKTSGTQLIYSPRCEMWQYITHSRCLINVGSSWENQITAHRPGHLWAVSQSGGMLWSLYRSMVVGTVHRSPSPHLWNLKEYCHLLTFESKMFPQSPLNKWLVPKIDLLIGGLKDRA